MILEKWTLDVKIQGVKFFSHIFFGFETRSRFWGGRNPKPNLGFGHRAQNRISVLGAEPKTEFRFQNQTIAGIYIYNNPVYIYINSPQLKCWIRRYWKNELSVSKPRCQNFWNLGFGSTTQNRISVLDTESKTESWFWTQSPKPNLGFGRRTQHRVSVSKPNNCGCIYI